MYEMYNETDQQVGHSEYYFLPGLQNQGAKKIIFTACHSGRRKLAFTSPDVNSTSPNNVLTSRIDFTVLLLFKFFKKHNLPVGKLKNEFTSPIAKSTSLGLLSLCTDTPFPPWPSQLDPLPNLTPTFA